MKKHTNLYFAPLLSTVSLLRRTLGCVGLVYNFTLAASTQAWSERQEQVGYKQTSAMLTNWKKQEDLNFLSEVSSVMVWSYINKNLQIFS